jgi:hypothetical protein
MQINIYFVDFFVRPPVRFRPVVFFPVRFTYALPSLKKKHNIKKNKQN